MQQQAGLLSNIKQFEAANAAAAKKLEEAKAKKNEKAETKKAEAKKPAAKPKEPAQEANPQAAPAGKPDDGPALFSDVPDDGDLPLSDSEKEELARKAFRQMVADEKAKREAGGEGKPEGEPAGEPVQTKLAVENPTQAKTVVDSPAPSAPGVEDVVKEDLNTLWSRARGLYQSRSFSAAREVFEQCRMLANPSQYEAIDKAIASCNAYLASTRIYQ